MEPTISRTLMELETGNLEEIYDHPEKQMLKAYTRGSYKQAESHLLSQISVETSTENQANRLWLLSQIYTHQHMPHSCTGLIKRLSKYVSPSDDRLKHLILQASRFKSQKDVGPVTLDNHSKGRFPHLDIEIGTQYEQRGNIVRAEEALNFSNAENSCEGTLLNAKIMRRKSQPKQAETLLLQNWAKFKHRLDYSLYMLELLFELRRGDICLPLLKEALMIQGCYGSPLLEWMSRAKSLQREPAVALRLKLIERLPMIAGAKVNEPTAIGCGYNDLGRSDWMIFLEKNIANSIALNFELHSNQLMQLSSLASPTYAKACTNLISLMNEHAKKQIPIFTAQLTTKQPKQLRIGWICGDINHHPVARFLYSWLSGAAKSLTNQHIVVATISAEPEYINLFNNLKEIQFIDQSQTKLSPIDRINELRGLKLDIAIDLNGWTGNNISHAFICRIATLQVNYLAYHASSGIPAMDLWIGDNTVFPSTEEIEWHTEQIVRLPRPFLAWQPQQGLPEATKQVPEISYQYSEGIRFGCFNNLRKLSDEILKCWGSILKELPASRLVLKANNCEDNGTLTLIKRRLERNGIKLDQIIWLPYTITPGDHLQQYEKMDVALDSFPNSGCTTSCEALWMGVPVVTLRGQHYVSRMASAVLDGAGISEWICGSMMEYKQLAISQANPERLAWLRQNRQTWRQKIIESPIGDANDLMNNLERVLSKHFQELMQK